MNRKAILGGAAFFAVISAISLLGPDASGTDNQPVNCVDPTLTIIDAAAYDEVIPGVPTLWGNWSPNRDQGPFEGPPAYPTDPRGTWQMHEGDGGPAGSGVFQQGNGNGSWFVRIDGTPDQVIHHDEVSHTIDNPDYPCQTTTVPDTTVPDTTVPDTTIPDGDCTEDMDCFDCETMGNRLCDPVSLIPPISIEREDGSVVTATPPFTG